MEESFVFYRSFREAISVMTPEDQLVSLLAICDYALYGKEPALSGMPFVVFTVAKPSLDKNKANRMNGKKGGRPKKETNGFDENNHRFSDGESGETNAERKESPANGRAPRFSPPSVEEVRAYCMERRNGVDPERFVDFYASKGWKVGREPMKDWKACVRTWERRDRDNGNGGGNGTPFEYDPGDMTGSL